MTNIKDYINSISDINQLQNYLNSIRSSGDNYGTLVTNYKDSIYDSMNNTQKTMINNPWLNKMWLLDPVNNISLGMGENIGENKTINAAIQNRIASLAKVKASGNAAAQNAAQANALTSTSESQNLATARTNLLNNSLKNYQTNLNKRAMNTRYTTT